MSKMAEQIASDFIAQWQDAWNEQGAVALVRLYASDAIFVGYKTVEGREPIEALFQGIIDQGWTRVEVRIVTVRACAGVILVANEYTAFGSGELEGKTLNAKSSHVLTEQNGVWLSAMHTAS